MKKEYGMVVNFKDVGTLSPESKYFLSGFWNYDDMNPNTYEVCYWRTDDASCMKRILPHCKRDSGDGYMLIMDDSAVSETLSMFSYIDAKTVYSDVRTVTEYNSAKNDARFCAENLRNLQKIMSEDRESIDSIYIYTV